VVSPLTLGTAPCRLTWSKICPIFLVIPETYPEDEHRGSLRNVGI
jgi:hypothetical protein